MLWGYGAPGSALTVHDNQIDVTLTPAADGKSNATITFTPDLAYYTLNAHTPGRNGYTPTVLTRDWSRPALQLFTRAPGSHALSIEGDVKPGGPAAHEEIALEDPAEYAAMALKAALIRHGVVVHGDAHAQHRPAGDLEGFSKEVTAPLAMPPQMLANFFQPGKPGCSYSVVSDGKPNPPQTVLAEHVSPPLLEDVRLTNKVSQNLHAEILLRNIARGKDCTASLPRSVQIVRQYWVHAGLDPADFFFYDGSGLSTKDVVTPRAVAQLLAYAATQPWFAQWKPTLPVAGEDGTLSARFGKDSPLRQHLFAKTGTLGETRALSGYLEAASGRTIIFSVLVDTHPPTSSADRTVMDKIIEAIAASY
jgi:D-alanyl-D-alanine carboxypeptidase/D-alanyl-D-alanine-endopeptidase (penicillin-binding protein 4)